MRFAASLVIASALSCALLLTSTATEAALDIGVQVNLAPPELPVYEQPEIPGPDYIWTPGYWAWSDDGYYWVPGTWVEAPQPGLLWTPGYWGWENGFFLWHPGYWGPEIGFYGGVNYGFGYFGHGYEGGYWDGGRFRYNTAYSNVRGHSEIVNVYNRTVVNNITLSHVSFNGGNGGLRARPDEREIAAQHAHHIEPVAAQIHQRDTARGNPDLRASFNHGHPAIAATSRAGDFTGHGVIAAHGAPPANIHAPQSSSPRNPAPQTPPPPTTRLQPEQHGQGQVPGRSFTASPQPPPQQHNQPQYQSRPPTPQVEQHGAPQLERAPPPTQHPPQNAPQVEHVNPPPQVHVPTPPPQQQAPHPQPQQSGKPPPRENERNGRDEK